MVWAKITSWARTRPILAIIGVVLILVALGSAYGGAKDWFAKRAEIRALKDAVASEKKKGEQEKAAWQGSMAVKDADFARIQRDRDVLRSKIARLQAAQSKPWVVPATDNELLTRFKALGY